MKVAKLTWFWPDFRQLILTANGGQDCKPYVASQRHQTIVIVGIEIETFKG